MCIRDSYYSILNKYGIQSITEKKFVQIVSACLKYSCNKRVEMFGRFLGLFEDSYSAKDFNFYLSMVKAVSSAYSIEKTSRALGVKVKNGDGDEVHYALYMNASEFVKTLSEKNWPELSQKVAARTP
eukprot:TRINITY_DN23670_c0_g1_i1.p1 TRINITY_DN23670_c0_g1~~TRINITY_DN23670_c0_g1_i1.p1  ORF type:complete len:127 (+),score=34.79 TRINITY_DN23670_c0_g1_i1:67-447(+)